MLNVRNSKLTVILCTLVGAVFLSSSLAWSEVCFPSTTQRVIVPFAQSGGGFNTGVAITNLNAVNATSSVTVTYYNTSGTAVDSENIGTINAKSMFIDLADSITDQSLPTNYWMLISHAGDEEIAVTVFLFNNANGFGFQTYNSQQFTSTICIPDILFPLPDPFLVLP